MAAVSSAKDYAATDLIPCKSVTQGELILPGTRSGMLYKWFSIGDVIDIEFQDLAALNVKQSRYLYEPHFTIEDAELLELPRWSKLKTLYDTMYSDAQDMDAILNLPPAQLKQTLASIPKSYAQALAIEVSTRIENGSYDSLKRIKVFDEILGTDLMCLIS